MNDGNSKNILIPLTPQGNQIVNNTCNIGSMNAQGYKGYERWGIQKLFSSPYPRGGEITKS
jgi:hypothetical protein